MSMDLHPRNKAAGCFSMGSFSWGWMLEQGVGLPVGHGRGIEPASFVYAGRPDGLTIGYNDGARVTAREARDMARIARWVADHQDRLHQLFSALAAERQKEIEEDRFKVYNRPIRKDWIELMRAFADWAEASGGFRVH